MAKYELFNSDHVEEWSALYIDGKLDTVGDSYLSDERIRELLGVEMREGNFLLCGRNYSDAAQTVEEIEVYEDERERKIAQARELQAQAKKLLDEANALTR